MRFIVLPALLIGCAPEMTVNGLPADHPDDMSAFLVDLPEVAFAERTLVNAHARGRLLPGGEPLYGKAHGTIDGREHIVVDANDAMGVIVDQRDWQLVVWLDRDDLATVGVVHTWMGGVRVPPGLPLEILDSRSGESLVAVRNNAIEVETWVPDTRLDQFWYSDDSPEAWEPEAGEGFAKIRPEAPLLDGPFGEPFGYVLPRDESRVSVTTSVLEEEQGFSRVAFEADGWPVEAWVHDDDLIWGSMGLWGYGFSCCGGVACGFGSLGKNVRADAPLYAEPAGAVVGRTKHDQYLVLDGEPGDWRSAELRTEFGTAEVFIDPEDLI